jgi:hypothetical protein
MEMIEQLSSVATPSKEERSQYVCDGRLREHRPHPNPVAKGKISTTARNRTSVVEPETSDFSDWAFPVSSCRYKTKVRLSLCLIERCAINIIAESRYNLTNFYSHH